MGTKPNFCRRCGLRHEPCAEYLCVDCGARLCAHQTEPDPLSDERGHRVLAPMRKMCGPLQNVADLVSPQPVTPPKISGPIDLVSMDEDGYTLRVGDRSVVNVVGLGFQPDKVLIFPVKDQQLVEVKAMKFDSPTVAKAHTQMFSREALRQMRAGVTELPIR